MPVVTINGTTVETDILMLLEAMEISRTLSGGAEGEKGGCTSGNTHILGCCNLSLNIGNARLFKGGRDCPLQSSRTPPHSPTSSAIFILWDYSSARFCTAC